MRFTGGFFVVSAPEMAIEGRAHDEDSNAEVVNSVHQSIPIMGDGIFELLSVYST